MTVTKDLNEAITAPDGPNYWRDVLRAGGFTAVPRWSTTGTPGVEHRETRVPRTVCSALHRLAEQWAVRPHSILLAAHARVLAALSGQLGVTTGLVAEPGGPALPCRLDTEPATWHDLVRHVERVTATLRTHRGVPIEPLRQELGLPTPLFETVFDPHDSGAVSENLADDLADDTVLRVTVLAHDDQLTLRVYHRTDVLDADAAERIMGYHATALALLTADPTAEHGRQGLLPAPELRYQLHGLAGRHRELPGRRAHELFEERVRAHPDAVAAVRGDQQLTYRELNARANRLARALLARDPRAEDVVAVVTERSLNWLVAVLAVFKAGGAYLPIEPHFPPDRIATTLTRAGCRLVLTEPGATANLDRALTSRPGVRTLAITVDQDYPDTDLGIEVAPDQLAYIYFTSGSTGEPKGAMCEHAGMLNHLFAKIDDQEVGPGSVVAQTAPQCFDISLWQLIAALLVGGRTVLVEQELTLDVGRFVQRIVDARVSVLQVVPSYLEVVLSHLDQYPRELPDLRYVSVTGEALKQELTERWFAAYPEIKLLNAYGLTETSDDTNHEVLDRPPAGRVPLGAPIHNIRVYVVDERLEPVPLGAPGMIVFSGICVGRGYINDPERTRAVYLADPHRPGERLYLSGDYGRWLPGGKVEFLGRRDSQIKLNGFRIELGEIEESLARVPGIRDVAVVVAERANRTQHLVGFYTAERPLTTEFLVERLAASLPKYMVPAALRELENLPLTANGKIDKKALAALTAPATDRATTAPVEAPHTPAELRLARAWAEVIGVPVEQIGRRDHFYDRGGTSLSAVKLAIALDRLLAVRDITHHPVLAEQAALLENALPPEQRS
ncbi:MAG TPA: amino acid adenylation domain-containing protein [Pseudonocardia sp.]|jgi:amino acid adenylation domain-containing protein